jgi:hypothetical protein
MVVAVSRFYPDMCLQGPRNATGNFSYESHCFDCHDIVA